MWREHWGCSHVCWSNTKEISSKKKCRAWGVTILSSSNFETWFKNETIPHLRSPRTEPGKCFAMCAWFLRQVREEEDFLRSVWFSDEAHFYLSGTVNSRNYVHWASERPDEVIERNLHVTKATAWVGLSAQGVIGPFWFCNEDGATETVAADRCMNVLTHFWRALGRFCGHEARGQQWFMQDGAAPHTARRVLTWLRLTDHFEGRVISRFTEKTWASHSPD